MLDKRDLLILIELRKNSRQSLASISRKTNIPVSTIFDKLINLNKSIIKRSMSLFNFSEIGYPLKVNFIIKCKENKGIKNFLLNKDSVNTIYRINNGDDFFVECIFKDMLELESFKMELIDFGIERLKEHSIVEEIKIEDFFTKKEHHKMLLKNG